MSEHQKLNEVLNASIAKIKEMTDVNTVIGDPITTPNGTTVIPISRVSCGFAAGGSDLPSKSQPQSGLFGGGTGAGITIVPIAFLVIQNNNVRVMQIEPYYGPVDRALEKVPEVVDKITALFQKEKPEEAIADEAQKDEAAEEAKDSLQKETGTQA